MLIHLTTMIDINELYSATNQGLDIIKLCYPEAEPNKLFKARNERTASTSIKLINGVYRFTDFGDDAVSKSPIDVYMAFENIPFNQALYKLAGIFNVGNVVTAETNKPKIEQTQTSEPDGITYEALENWTPELLSVWLPSMKAETMTKYGWAPVKSYTSIKNGKKTVITATEKYPMYVHDCGDFCKLYKPFDFQCRFMYIGAKPKDYVNGLTELRNAYNDYKKANEVIDVESGEQKEFNGKLPEAVICSGERDAMAAASLGYFPLWLNSETATLPVYVYNEVKKMVERIYNIPDIDSTGVKRGAILALQYPDIFTIELPQWLSEYRDAKGHQRKDLRDYLELRDSKDYRGLGNDFKNLCISAKCCKFWSEIPTEKGYKYEINSAYLLRFLKYSGYRKIKALDGSDVFVKVENNIIKEVTASDIRTYLIAWVQDRNLGTEIENLVLNSKKTATTSANDLELLEPNLTNFNFNTQYYCFQNAVVKITARGVEPIRESDCMFMEKSVIPHSFRRLNPAFESDGETIKINSLDSHFFRYLINASRIYWRKEFETNEPDMDREYISQNQWAIDGDRLNAEEIAEQTKHLINKIYAIGYLLHRHKSVSQAFAIWVMENKITDEAVSSGGSGKSFLLNALSNLLNITGLNGRDSKMTDNTHFMDRVNKETNVVHCQDFAGQMSMFDYFYNFITDNMTINPKRQQSIELEFKDSPKIVFTSNFAPPIKTNDSSSFRRLLFMVYSDYYHSKTADNGYREERRIYDDFGMNIMTGEKYAESYWNEDFNFMFDCLHFYLQMVDKKVRCQAPLENVYARIRRQQMGDNFLEWADQFFAQGGDNVDTFVPYDVARMNYEDYSNIKHTSSHTFKNKLKCWCNECSYVQELNPAGYLNSSGRIIQNVNGKTKECLYIVTKKTESSKSDTNNDVPF